MCGIFGIVRSDASAMPQSLFRHTVDRLFALAESRGRESAGLAVVDGGSIFVYKQPIPASRLVRQPRYRQLVSDACQPAANGSSGASMLIGHSRLVTNGAGESNENNQPVMTGGLVGIHNGIIVNDDELWSRHPSLQRKHEVDTEVLLSLVRMYTDLTGSVPSAVRSTFEAIRGCASIAVLFSDLDELLLGTNNASLYLCCSTTVPVSIFVSERSMLERLLAHGRLRRALGTCDLSRLEAGEGCFIGLRDNRTRRFEISKLDASLTLSDRPGRPRKIIDVSGEAITKGRVTAYNPPPPPTPTRATRSGEADLLMEARERIHSIRRCSRCILPETFPFIDFDDEGVCSYCRTHQPITVSGAAALAEVADQHRRGGEPDCLVGISGGRDSCYGLHYVKAELGLNPIAYTYDWGMVTDLARRNISRMCATLGIEHILVSADINRKRRNIRKNVAAWLKRPALGMVPLFMAGDKQFYYHANRLSRQTGIKFFIFCAGNEYEQTRFKTGFCGLSEGADKGILTSLPLGEKLRLAAYFGGQYARNPAYLNVSMLDTVGAFAASYLMPHDYVYLFHCIRWDEQETLALLRDRYDWESADDTIATWRIGDGTAAFYNYIYYTVAGFTEFDTFRSTQIRENAITRSEALTLVNAENRPRYESLKWYFDVIGLDQPFEQIIRRINDIPKLYES